MDSGSNSVSVIDTNTNSVVATIGVGSSPSRIAFNPAGTYAYVTNSGGNSISVIDTSTNSVVATIPVGNAPGGIAFNGTYAYVTNAGGNSVSVIDTGTNSVVATIPVGGAPGGIAFNPAGTYAYVANSGSNSISVIDTSTNCVIVTIYLSDSPALSSSSIGVPPSVTMYTIIASADPNGSISPAGNVPVMSGGSRTFNITPNAGYHIADVQVDGISVGAVTAYTFNNVSANHTISAAFAINTYPLTVNKAGTGSGSVGSTPSGISCGNNCAAIYNYGTTVILAALADPGCTFTGWAGACTGTGPCTVAMDAAKSVTATFADTTPPHVEISATPNMLWPPNHKMVDVTINGTAADNESGIASVVITVQDEYGKYNMTVPGFGSTISLEAWRDGTDKDGRHYTITAVATDKAGNKSTAVTQVIVPHDMSVK